MRVIFDTNVYLASLKENSMSEKILQAVLAEETDFFLYISLELKKELAEKLESPKITKLASAALINRLRFAVDNFVPVVTPREQIDIIKNDPDDNRVLECALAAEADIIITMDRDLLRLKAFRNIAIIHPKTFSYFMPKASKKQK